MIHRRIPMKNKALCLILFLALALSALSSCASSYETLYETVSNGITYRVNGANGVPREIIVLNYDSVLWKKRINVTEEVGNLHGSYGFFTTDFNFDGKTDFMIACEKKEDDVYSYLCYINNGTNTSFAISDELSALYNVRANRELSAIFGFTREKTQTEGKYYALCDASTKYVWEKGALLPQIRASVTYYSKQKLYCYSVAYYDKETKSFGPTTDRWLSPREYEQADMDFLYYFK